MPCLYWWVTTSTNVEGKNLFSMWFLIKSHHYSLVNAVHLVLSDLVKSSLLLYFQLSKERKWHWLVQISIACTWLCILWHALHLKWCLFGFKFLSSLITVHLKTLVLCSFRCVYEVWTPYMLCTIINYNEHLQSDSR